jgi:DNA polymerase-3 subunit delta'
MNAAPRAASGEAPFPGIVGQPRATGALARALAAGRLCPSLLFHGAAGVGKLATALALSRALLCRAPQGRPCGDCPACRRIDERSLRHPDVRVVFPERASDFEKGEVADEGGAGIDLQERQAEAVRNPVWSILIARIRQTIGMAQRRPLEGPVSVLIVDQAHRMEAAAANALLKTLEEPPAHACLVLITTSYHALIPTIRSRCQAIPFQAVPREAVASYLIERLSIDPGEAALRAGLSGGCIGAAIDLDLEAFRRRREALLAILEEVGSRDDPGIAVARAESLVRGGEGVEGDLEILMTLVRDLLLLGASPGDDSRLIHLDLVDRLRRLAERAALGPGAVDDLEATIDAIRRKGNRQLLVENYLMGLLPGPRAATAPLPR